MRVVQVKYISFAWTTPALLHGRKTVTRRDWNPRYARQFRAGMEVTAYDRLPRNGGTPIARLRLTHDAMYESDADAPDDDWEAEGFAWFWERECERAFADGFDAPYGEIAERVEYEGFETWRRAGGSSWVIRFDVVEYVRGPLAGHAPYPSTTSPSPSSSACLFTTAPVASGAEGG